MAILIPPKPRGSAAPSVVRMFQALRRLPDTFTVWFALDSGLPHFFILWQEQYGFLVQVASTTQQLAETALQGNLLSDTEVISAEDLGRAEKEVLDRFLIAAETKRHLQLSPTLPLRRLVVFPNVEQSTIDRIELLHSQNGDTPFLGMKQSTDDAFARQLQELAAAPLAEPELFALRSEFTPEAVIHDSCRAVPLAKRYASTQASLGFLDFDQESLVKLDLELSSEAKEVAANSNARLVTGLAGSGKSLVLLHRAVQIARLRPEARMLVLTHNRPINGELQRRFHAMMPGNRNIAWKTFFGWLHTHLPDIPSWVLSTTEAERILSRLKPSHPALEKFTAAFLTEEINYLRDLGIRSEEEYLALDRLGRATGLTKDKRGAIWRLLEAYRAELAKEKTTDWHELALRFHELASKSPASLAPKGYDFIFIDEAQFFAKAWFPPVLASLKPGGQLFLSADSTQGFLKRRQSWLAAGIDVRGRSNRLMKAYRTTRRLLSFATHLYLLKHPRGNEQDFADETDLADKARLDEIREEGEWPEIHRVTDENHEIREAVERIARIREKRPDLAGRIVLLHTDFRAQEDLKRSLERKLGKGSVRDAKDYAHTSYSHFCTVSTLNAATGLEAAIVFVLGLDGLLDRQKDPRLDAEALAEMQSDHAKMLYVACTRAARKLVLYARSDDFEALLQNARQAAEESARNE